jgi:hypothetical protein
LLAHAGLFVLLFNIDNPNIIKQAKSFNKLTVDKSLVCFPLKLLTKTLKGVNGLSDLVFEKIWLWKKHLKYYNFLHRKPNLSKFSDYYH